LVRDDAIHTAGTDTIVGPRHAPLRHHLFISALIKLALRGEIGGFAGIGVFQALVA
jgi:hypothetical protein